MARLGSAADVSAHADARAIGQPCLLSLLDKVWRRLTSVTVGEAVLTCERPDGIGLPAATDDGWIGANAATARPKYSTDSVCARSRSDSPVIRSTNIQP